MSVPFVSTFTNTFTYLHGFPAYVNAADFCSEWCHHAKGHGGRDEAAAAGAEADHGQVLK
jgi:hypothetical protein